MSKPDLRVVPGLRGRPDEVLAVAAGGLLVTAGLSERHLHCSGDDLRKLSEHLLAAAGLAPDAVGYLRATLATMARRDVTRAALQDAFGHRPVTLICGAEPAGASSQLDLIACLDAPARREGDAVHLGPLVVTAAPLPETKVAAGDLSAQAEAALGAICASLAGAGQSRDDIVKIRNTVAVWHGWSQYNAVYDRLFSGSQAARCSVGGLAEDPCALVQVEAFALSGADRQYVDSTRSGVGRTNFVTDPRTIYLPQIGPCKGPHSHAARVGDLIFISGQCPYDAEDRLVGAGDVAAQTAQTLANIEISLTALGAGLADVIKFDVTVSDARFATDALACLRSRCGGTAALSCVAAPLGQYGLMVEIEALAVRGSAENRIVFTAGEG